MDKTIKIGILLICLCIWLVGMGFAAAGLAAGASLASAMKMGICVSLSIAAFIGAIVAIVFGVYFLQKKYIKLELRNGKWTT